MSELDLIMADVERAERTGTPIYDEAHIRGEIWAW